MLATTVAFPADCTTAWVKADSRVNEKRFYRILEASLFKLWRNIARFTQNSAFLNKQYNLERASQNL